MHVPALTAVVETPDVSTAGGAVPRQSGLMVASCLGGSGISTPFVPAATIFASSSSVSQAGRGRSSVPMESSARETLAPATSVSAAARPATTNSLRMDPPCSSEPNARSAPLGGRVERAGNPCPVSSNFNLPEWPPARDFPTALAKARRAAGLDGGDPVPAGLYPPPVSLQDEETMWADAEASLPSRGEPATTSPVKIQ